MTLHTATDLDSALDPGAETLPPGWPVLVTGAGGFVGGHVARALARAGCRVRALTRRPPRPEAGDPELDWILGDLRNAEDRARAVEGVRGVVHTAGWVSLGSDPRGESRTINVEATRDLLDRGRAAGVERFVYTSTLWTVAAGTPQAPANEDSAWNLEPIRSPYCDSKREAEQLVLQHNGPGLRTTVLCPGLVIGPRDVRPTSTRVLLEIARVPVALLPAGGIPVVDSRTVARAHVRALERAPGGQRYVVAGPYLSYPEMAKLVARVTGRPHRVVVLADVVERVLAPVAGLADRLARGRWPHVSAAAIAGGFLRLHVSGSRADEAFGLVHPDPIRSIREALEDARMSGRASWLGALKPLEVVP